MLGRRPACADTATLGQAHAAGAVDPSATVGDIGYYCTPGAPADAACLAGHTPILLSDFVLDGLPAEVTLEDLLASLLSDAAYDWEALPLPGFPIQDFSNNGGINDYAIDFSLAATKVVQPPCRSWSSSRTAHATSWAPAACPVATGRSPDPTLDKGNEPLAAPERPAEPGGSP